MEPDAVLASQGRVMEDPGAPTEDRYAAIFARHHARLLHVAELVAGDRELAADAVAEAFARTYPHWKRGKVDDIGAYLRRATINEITRSWRRRPPAPARDPIGDGAVHRGASDAGADAVAERDRVARVLAQLSTRHRAALVLRYFEDLSEADIAAALGIPPGTVKSTLSRALDRVRTLMRENDEQGADHG
jgi:RNA polymerase sigma-70 factor (sigma-E family)